MRAAALSLAGLTVALTLAVGLIASVDRERAAQRTAYEQAAVAVIDELVARVSFEVERGLLGGVDARTDAVAVVNEARGRLSATAAPAGRPADSVRALDTWLERLGQVLADDDATRTELAAAWDELVTRRRALGGEFADPAVAAVVAVHDRLEGQQAQQEALLAFDEAGAERRREERAALQTYAVEVRGVLSDVEERAARLDEAALAQRTLDTEAAVDEADRLFDAATDELAEAAQQLDDQEASRGFVEPHEAVAEAVHDLSEALEDAAPVISRADCTHVSDPDDCAPVGDTAGYADFAAARAEAEQRYTAAEESWSRRYRAETRRLWGLDR